MKRRQYSTLVKISIRVEVFRLVWVKGLKDIIADIKGVSGFET